MIDINEFYSSLTTNPKMFLNLPVFWSVSIDGVTTSAINSFLSYAGERWSAKVDPKHYMGSETILVASSVNLPNEGGSFSPGESNNMGGFLPGTIGNSRLNFVERGLSVNFLETATDIEHYYFRPWSIAVSIKGLIEQGASLKGTMTVKQYSNDGKFIKGFRLNKVFPTACESYTLSYEDSDIKQHSVTFACSNYEQL